MEEKAPRKTAIVFSGGGLFGAWQAGVWAELQDRVEPDLVVGASVGALNGYAVACGADGGRLASMWRDPGLADFSKLGQNIETMMGHFSPKIPFALTVTDLLRMRPVIFQGEEITPRHMAASCAIPMVFQQYWINGRLCSDGGLLNPLPVWAAIELGATHVIAVHALPEIPGWWMKPIVTTFRWFAGFNPPLPKGVQLDLILPARHPIGGLRDAIRYRPENIERWIAEGRADAVRKNISILDCPRG
jgi:NTE family protein